MAALTQPGAYEALGGAAGIDGAVRRFYERVLADPELAPYFTDADLVRLHAHQVAFLSAAVGGPRGYDGRSLAAAHAGIEIPNAAFDRVLDHLVDALGESGADGALIEAIVETLTTLETEVAGLR